MAHREQLRHDGRADPSGGPGDEDLQGCSSPPVLRRLLVDDAMSVTVFDGNTGHASRCHQ
ncbi:MAG: hypothetical protein AVDCRST_MAG48-1111 [uncultured Friedmanniella sp.]|uniref:Uncharacterized protein n=1 Tax=uncultured Friedmanniella sp. TaxID=335381 RepID=A0A6J4K8M3_9ACTN|nr:MAG: hypothetical protein AVDCRST_MAG48-1111 [uncultured Friedmanniella sp.]